VRCGRARPRASNCIFVVREVSDGDGVSTEVLHIFRRSYEGALGISS
jgi:hypothetical protein